MPVSFSVEENGHLIRHVFTDPWTVTEVEESYIPDIAYRNSVPFIVHSLVDLTTGQTMPIGVLRLRTSPILSHPRNGHIALIGVTPLVQALADVLFRIIQNGKVKAFASEAEALAFLRNVIAAETDQTVDSAGKR